MFEQIPGGVTPPRESGAVLVLGSSTPNSTGFAFQQQVLFGRERRLADALIEALCHNDAVGPFILCPRALAHMSVEIEVDQLTVAESLGLVVGHISAMGCWSDGSAKRMARELARWERYLRQIGIELVIDVGPHEVHDLVETAVAWRGNFTEPATSTQRFRLASVRLFYRSLRQLHVVLPDPTLDIRLQSGEGVPTRPLTDEEELLGRVVSAHTLSETRRPVAWALGQATATTGEQARVLVRDVDLVGRRVWLRGNARRTPRWGDLTDWGHDVVARALVRLGDEPEAGLVYGAQTSEESGTASACDAVHEVLKDAGYDGSSGTRPGSLPAWRGAQIFNETGDIFEVARRLGFNSVDAAIDAIGLTWR